MKHLRYIIAIVTLCLSASVRPLFAQKPGGYIEVDYSDSYITPKWFGPYAFPIPDFLEGNVCNKLSFSVSGDCAVGNLAGTSKELRDITHAITFDIRIPLWSDRVTLSAWGEIFEFYNDSQAVRELRRVDPKHPLKGHDAGNTYASIDIVPLREGKWYPSAAVRIGTLFATGDEYERARHYDTPGYFFDGSLGKSFNFGKCSSVRASASIGFICWQISKGRQFDALMYGGKISYSNPYTTLGVEIGTFNGREKEGDAPLTLKSRLSLHFGRFSPFFYYAHGFRDWPFDLYRVGLTVDFDVLKKK